MRNNGGNGIIITFSGVIVGLIIGLNVHGAHLALAGEESSLDATVEVKGNTPESYGDWVIASRQVLLPRQALGEPNRKAVLILGDGWETIKLRDTVNDTELLSVWAASSGWGASHIRVFVSENGNCWASAGKFKVNSASFRRYDLSGSLGDIGYVKIERSGSLLALIRLDAVAAKGGDEEPDNNNKKDLKPGYHFFDNVRRN